MIECYPNGRVKRVEFHDPEPDQFIPYIPPVPYAPLPYGGQSYTITCGSTSNKIVVTEGENPTATTRITGIYYGQ